ncbi:MAG: type II toxin-antitoxin system PemK/MazF family toxin [Thermoleophilaceae bacterium]
MRPIHAAQLDRARPVLVLTRELVRPHLTRVTVAPITTNARGLSTEVAVGRANGLDAECVVSCDNIVTVPAGALGRQIGVLLPAQEDGLTGAIHAAFDLG